MAFLITVAICFTVLLLALINANAKREQEEIRARAARDWNAQHRNAKN